jgi:hypothetical protein
MVTDGIRWVQQAELVEDPKAREDAHGTAVFGRYGVNSDPELSGCFVLVAHSGIGVAATVLGLQVGEVQGGDGKERMHNKVVGLRCLKDEVLVERSLGYYSCNGKSRHGREVLHQLDVIELQAC